MKRRLFAKLLALGAGSSFPLMQLAADESEVRPPEKIGPGRNGRGSDPAQAAAAIPDAQTGGPVNIEEFIPLAKAKLPKATFEYITTGSEDEVTLRENVAAFRRINVVPPILHGVSDSVLSTTVLKQKISLPVMLAPVAAQRMYHPQGALAAARAASATGTVYVVSTSVGNSVEEIAAVAKGPLWFQFYVPKDRGVARRLVERVEKAGYQAIVVTVDLGERKDADRRNRFTVPKDMLLKHLRDVGHTQLTEKLSYQELLAFNDRAWELSLSWDFFKWLRSITKLPLLVKGVLRKEDALKAVSLGLDGIIVSNHGARRLDTMPASIDTLPEIADAVDGRCEILMDSGIRRGTDVLKALALGAKAVLIGRPYAWGLAVDGEDGVRRVVELLREEFQNAMITCGCANVGEIKQSLVVPPT